jgi:hypothetical protein
LGRLSLYCIVFKKVSKRPSLIRVVENLPPMIQAIHVLILLHVPFSRHVRHSQFLSLVYKSRPSLHCKKYGKHLGAPFSVLDARTRKSVDGSRLVMILEIQRVPAAIRMHEFLPLGNYAFEILERPSMGRKLSVFAMVNVNAERLYQQPAYTQDLVDTYCSKLKIMFSSPLSCRTLLITCLGSRTYGISPTLNASYSRSIWPIPFKYSWSLGPAA